MTFFYLTSSSTTPASDMTISRAGSQQKTLSLQRQITWQSIWVKFFHRKVCFSFLTFLCLVFFDIIIFLSNPLNYYESFYLFLP